MVIVCSSSAISWLEEIETRGATVEIRCYTIFNNYSPMANELEANICFITVFRGEFQGLQNNRIKLNKSRRNSSYGSVHIRMQPYRFDSKLTCTSIGNKTNNETLRKINSSGSFVASLLTSFTIVITVEKLVPLVCRTINFGPSIRPAGDQSNLRVYDS